MNKIEICNIALGRIGVENISRLDEESEAARTCRQYYDFARQNLLRQFPWTFAVRKVQLALLTTTPEDYKYAYRYPAECLAVRTMYHSGCCDRIPKLNMYKIGSDEEGRVIYTNIEKAVMEYTADIEDASLFDAQFIDALAWKLAAEIAFKLTGRMDIAQNAQQAYLAFASQAQTEDANEENLYDSQLDRLALARFTGV